ncbi:tetratricopeptide repeat protein [Pseudodesulfovibrio sediminis]|uniref:Tetratricopeptide repeat protein n=1 Tax=Pseudodesulfovibrio sediminis TaxID=2810563 RepID=A0ABN6ERM8_9BACT|nr:tetratricopeptide repeat protein [Pseudodesulfovibrio sediminis]BCS88082.1 hypothetical protein PSDVSF_13240 [Pseudodesulfovibrio sediminis]
MTRTSILLTRPLHILLLFGVLVSMHCPALADTTESERLTPRQFAAVVDARNFMDTGQPDKAVRRLLPLAQGERPPLTILSHLAWAQADARDTDAAMQTYMRASALYPEDANTARNLGIMLLEKGRPHKAAAILEQAYNLQPEGAKEPALLMQAASALARADAFDPALRLIDRAEHTAKTVPVVWTALAVYCCLRLDRTHDALRYCHACTHAHPESVQAWTMLSRVLVRRNDPLAAAAALETAQSLGRSDTDAASMAHAPDISAELASLYARGHAYAEAARLLPQDTTPHAALRAAELFYLSRQNTAALKALDTEARRADRTAKGRLGSLRAALLRGRILMDMRHDDEAVACLLAAATPSPADATAIEHRLRGEALLLAGEIRWMERDWNRAARIFSTLAMVPGYGNTGTSLATSMRALLREAALTIDDQKAAE